MHLINNWERIRTHFKKSFSTNLHVTISSVNADHQPTTSVIGSFFLNKDQTGFYFEEFTTKLPTNAKANKNVCVVAVNSSKRFWIKSLFKGKFIADPAIRLYGILGEKRKATKSEKRALERRVRYTRRLKGHQILWTSMDHVREIKFTKAEQMKVGTMKIID